MIAATLMVAGAQAELLATWSIYNTTEWVFYDPAPVEHFDRVALGMPGAPDLLLYEDMTVDSSYFPEISNLLTDGINSDYMLADVIFSPIGYRSILSAEADVFGSSPYCLNGIDFAGYTLDAISLKVDDFATEVRPWLGEFTSKVDFTGTISFYGTAIPEPSSAVLIATFGGFGLFFRRVFAINQPAN